MTVEEVHPILFKYIADAYGHGREVRQLVCCLAADPSWHGPGWTRDWYFPFRGGIEEAQGLIDAALAAYRHCYVFERQESSIEVVRIAPHLLTSSVTVRSGTGPYQWETKHSYPVFD